MPAIRHTGGCARLIGRGRAACSDASTHAAARDGPASRVVALVEPRKESLAEKAVRSHGRHIVHSTTIPPLGQYAA